jgi:CRP-like cAMP-binding protein
VSDFLKTKRDEIAARLRELEPLVDEYRQLEAASAALAGLPGTAARAPRTPSKARRTRATTTRTTTRSRRSSTSGRRGRPRGSGTRAIQTLELVKSKPGITIPEIASAMGIKQNYLYRVLPGLEKDGKVVKRDRGWHAKT